MTLRSWIEQNGIRGVMSKTGATYQAVYQWKVYTTCPRDEMKGRIFKASRGRVTYKNMIDPYLKHHGIL